MTSDLSAAERDSILAYLDFHVAAGVDLAIDEVAHDRFAEMDTAPISGRPGIAASAAAVPPSGQPSGEARERASGTPPADPVARPPKPAARPPDLDAVPPRLPAAARAPTEAVATDARRQAASARTLPELEALLRAFDGCALKATAKQLCFADGTPGSRVMILGEAPGAEEDRTGTPFVGRAGQLLDRMLASIGLDRQQVYIANVVPWRPPGNRTPTPQEIAICLPFTERQIELAAPEILVTVGAPATQTVLGAKEGIMRLRGRWSEHVAGARSMRVLPMLHPAYLLRQPLHKRLAWRDLQLLRAALAVPDAPALGLGGTGTDPSG